MMFELKYHCPHCRLFPDSTTNHDHFLTCFDSRQQQTKKIANLRSRLDKLHTPPPIWDLLINHEDNYYNYELYFHLPSTPTNPTFIDGIAKQTSIGWEHFIRDRITSSLHPVINTYYRINKLGRRFKFSSWYRNIIHHLWYLYHTAWIEYCDTVHSSTKLNILSSLAKTHF